MEMQTVNNSWNVDSTTVVIPTTGNHNLSSLNTTMPSNMTSPDPVPFIPWDNPHNIISFETRRIIELAFNCVVDPLLWVIGVTTNVLNCLVFKRQGLQDRMNLCLFSLAVIDSLYLTFNLVVDSHRFFSAYDPQLAQQINAYLLSYISGPNIALMLTSGAMTMIVALERCACVVLPMKAATLMRTRSMGILVVGVVVVLQVAAGGTLTARFKVETTVDTETGLSRYGLTATDFYFRNPVLFDVLEFIFVSPVLPVMTFTVVSVATAVTVVKLRAALAWRASTSSAGSGGEAAYKASQQQTALTKVLVLVSCLYIACSAPSVAMAFTRFLVPDDGFKPWGRFANAFYATHDIAYSLAAFNSSVNFFIYYWRSTRYRSTLQRILKPCQPPGRQTQNLSTDDGLSVSVTKTSAMEL